MKLARTYGASPTLLVQLVDLKRNMDVDWGKGDAQPWGHSAATTIEVRMRGSITLRLDGEIRK